MKIRPAILLGLLVPSLLQGEILVNLDATGLPTGALSTWTNTGTLGGTFAKEVDTPNVVTVSGVKAVVLDGTNDWYVGPAAPASITGSGSRTIEVWAYNPALAAEETMVAWGRRGGGDGTNGGFGFGNNLTYGAGSHWGAADMGWAVPPTAATWHHLVYTYDGSTVRVYDNGVLKNSKVVALNTWAVNSNSQPLPIVIGTQNEQNGTHASATAGSLSIAKVRVHDTALASSAIEANYLAEGAPFAKGQPVLRSFASNASGAVPSGTPVVLSWDVAGANSVSISGAPAISGSSGSVVVSPTTTTVYTLTATNAAGSSTQNVTVTVGAFTPPAMTHRYNFNEASGTAVNDLIGTAHGNVVGTGWTRPAGQVSLPGGASGSAPYINFPNGLLSSLTNCTIEGWVTVNGNNNWARIFDFGSSSAGELSGPGGSGDGTSYLLLSAQVGGDQAVQRLAIRANGQAEVGANFNYSVPQGQETHFALVYSATGNAGSPLVSYYRDGQLIGTLPTTYPLSQISDVNNWLGRSNWMADANLNGSYNEFRIWSGAFTPGDITQSKNLGPATAPTGPYINAFFAHPATIYDDESTTLYWGTTNQQAPFTATISPAPGAVTGTSGNTTVMPGAVGTFTYTFAGTNPQGTRSAQTVVTVLSGAPTANAGSVTVPHNTATAVALSATDPNTAAGALTYNYTQPAHGTVTGAGANVTYTPTAGYSGPDSFTFTASDASHTSAAATVSITVLTAPANPTDVKTSTTALLNDLGTGSFVARLQAVDGNTTDTHTFVLVPGTGATHNAYFTIVGNQLISAHNFSGDVGQVISIRVSVTDSTGRSLEKIINFPVQAAAPHVKINEINYNSARNTQLTEFIELYNPTGATVDLSGWRFNSGINYIFPAGTSIAAGGYVVIAKHPPTLAAIYGVTALGPWDGGLDSQGEEIILRDTLGNKIDGVDYGITAPWPTACNGDGPTLELVHPSLDNDQGGNWRASTVTPATVNYVTAGATGWRYRKGTSEASSPVQNWRLENFVEDGTWLTGAAPIGVFKLNSDTAAQTNAETGVTLATQLTDMATYNGGFAVNYRSVFFRRTFTATSDIPKQLLLRVMHNDAAIIWINGVEVARFGFPENSPANPAYNTTAYYERANDPWSEIVLTNAQNLLHSGTNTIAIQGFAKPPQLRSTQEDNGSYNLFDFAIDASLTNVPDLIGTPGTQNSVFSAVNSPSVRNITHAPAQPTSSTPITVTARVDDPQGVGTVSLSYQLCAPGNFIPSTLPISYAALQANPYQPLPANGAFEHPSNWTTLTMVDNGSVAGDIAGDGIYTAIIPAQPHRTLVRYRITASDLPGQSVRVPAVGDPRLNFATFVYNGVPGYNSIPAATMRSLPAYHWVTRSSDYTSMLAYQTGEQLPNSNALLALIARRYENWEGALVVGDQVIDHAFIRLRGGNSRYMGSGRRHFHFKFPKGTPLQAEDDQGKKFARKWEDMLFNKQFGNKGYYDFGLTYRIGGKMWELVGVPIPQNIWVNFRVIQHADEANASLGDFWGMYQALEYPDGKNFLDARNLPAGNFYKMSDWIQNGEMSDRYQAAAAVDFGEDFDNIRYNIHQGTSQADMEKFVNMPLYYRYSAIQEAIRHYDLFAEPTGRHRVKNLIWWFEPQAGNNLGRCWFMPYDWDASFGPNWNSGYEMVVNALFNYFTIPDSPTWTGAVQNRTAMLIERRNAIREVRDLLVYRDGSGRGPVDDIIDDAYARIASFWPADRLRWPTTGAQADHPNGAIYKAADMKSFLFSGWTDPVGNNDPAVGAGGRAAYLDSISDGLDLGLLPVTPTITDTSSPSHPVDGLAFTTSAFSDPQGAGTFSALQWRVGEVTNPAAPEYDAAAPRVYEITEVWTSGVLTTFNANVTVPGSALRAGHTYRARVRHRDNTGRWSHWSQPATFTTAAANYLQVLKENLVVSELMYKPSNPTGPETAAGYLENDFEWIELRNVSTSLTLDLSNVRFTKGIDFNFAGSAITTLAPGASVLVVKNPAAFALRHGAGKPVAGGWDPSDSLSNSGEQVKLSFGAGAAIHDFTYDDEAPWPTKADDGGYSLVLKSPETRPDHALAVNWRASTLLGGTPGVAGSIYSEWATTNSVSSETSDTDGDGISALLEYALGGNPGSNNRSILPVSTVQNLVVGGNAGNYLTLTFRRLPGAEDLQYSAQFTTTMETPGSWNNNGVLVSSTPNADGTVSETWRAPTALSDGPKQFARMRATKP